LTIQTKIMKKNFTVLYASFAFLFALQAQNAPFNIALEPMTISGLGGLQSYAWGQYDGKWLIIGGRLDGLHRRQPFAAFDALGNNTQLIVVDPIAKQKWTAPLSALPTGMQEQLSSTNMQFYQNGDYLYLTGGYGYSATAANHITFAKMSAVKVADVIAAVIAGTAYNTHFRQITDSAFAVTGGYLNKIYDTYYLTGGQKFTGRYNPQGPDHGPGFVQAYTNAICKFKITDNGTNLSITHLPSYYDAANLHRRDYNVAHQIMPNGQEGITAFSGVFQAGFDLPFLNSVNIDSSGYAVNNAFSQYYNHYHCAHIPLYSALKNEMHTVFFGGIAQYFDSAGILVQDNNVPFVKTIARVSRNAAGVMSEYKLPVDMPALLGAGSEFIPAEGLSVYPNEVIKLDDLNDDSTLLGYIYGGISSSAPNVFFTNTGTQSTASSQIFKVYAVKTNGSGLHALNAQSRGTLHLQVYPNPNDGHFLLLFNLNTATDVQIRISDVSGKTILSTVLQQRPAGENSFSSFEEGLRNGGTYFVTLSANGETVTQKIIIAAE